MNFEDRFHYFIQQNHLISSDESVLLAVSGGVDSMVLLHLFMRLPNRIGVVHVNHQLRGQDAGDDARFVESFCTNQRIPFFIKTAEPSFWVGKNVQSAARDLRYTFFQHVADTENFRYIATAHHADDEIETFLLNALRGAGIEGLAGIPVRNGNIIRPLLFANRKETEEYALEKQIIFRHDKSNFESKYYRNFIRNKVMPHFDESDFRHRKGFYQTMQNMKEDKGLLEELIREMLPEWIQTEEDSLLINLDKILEKKSAVSLLFHILKPYGFNRFQVVSMAEVRQNGSRFYTENYMAIREKSGLQLYNRQSASEETPVHICFDSAPATYEIDGNRWELIFTEISNQTDFLALDPEKIVWPLFIRLWNNQDRFQPLSMKGKHKAIKKILSEQGIPIVKRPSVQVLVDASGQVLALLPGQLSHVFVGTANKSGFLDIQLNGKSLLYGD